MPVVRNLALQTCMGRGDGAARRSADRRELQGCSRVTSNIRGSVHETVLVKCRGTSETRIKRFQITMPYCNATRGGSQSGAAGGVLLQSKDQLFWLDGPGGPIRLDLCFNVDQPGKVSSFPSCSRPKCVQAWQCAHVGSGAWRRRRRSMQQNYGVVNIRIR